VYRWFADAHPFLWLPLVASVPAFGAAYFADATAPSYALNSAWVYRLEVWLAFFLGLYVAVLAIWLAQQGRSVRGIQLPGGPGIDLPDPDLDTAASGFQEFERSTRARQDRADESIRILTEQVADLQDTLTALEPRTWWQRVRGG
jgi:hypothetical protein